jgi:hypothetical protein
MKSVGFSTKPMVSEGGQPGMVAQKPMAAQFAHASWCSQICAVIPLIPMSRGPCLGSLHLVSEWCCCLVEVAVVVVALVWRKSPLLWGSSLWRWSWLSRCSPRWDSPLVLPCYEEEMPLGGQRDHLPLFLSISSLSLPVTWQYTQGSLGRDH